MQPTKPKRSYNSTRRKQQARETRRQIIAAAQNLFFERGYTGTSIEAIAQEAGVAAETVYAVFGNKLAILIALVDVSIVGDDLPIPLLQRPNILQAQNITDQRQLIRKFANDICEIMKRMSPVFALLRATAKAEPEIGSMLDKLLHERLQGMIYMIQRLKHIGPLRADITPERAAATVWAVSSAEVFHLFTKDLRWSEEQYTEWLEDALVRLLC